MTTPQTTISLSGPAGLIRAVPLLLGFRPRESLVVLCLRGKRLGPVMRIDLPDPLSDRYDDDAEYTDGSCDDDSDTDSDTDSGQYSDTAGYDTGIMAAAEYLADRALPYADAVALIAYSAEPDAAMLLHQVLDVMRTEGLGIVDAMVVDGDRVTFLPDDAGRTDDPLDLSEISDPAADALSAALAMEGRAVLPDRAALTASIAPPRGPALRLGGKAMIDARKRAAAGSVVSGFPSLDAAVWQSGDHGQVDLPTAADLALCVQDVGARDTLIGRILADRETPWVPALIGAVSVIPAAESVDLCAVLALAAYRSGDGALAQDAVQRCLQADPDHRLSLLVGQMLDLGMPPAMLDPMGEELVNAPDTA